MEYEKGREEREVSSIETAPGTSLVALLDALSSIKDASFES